MCLSDCLCVCLTVCQANYWSIPLIYYQNFLSFLSRHCGHWTNIIPDIIIELKTIINNINEPLLALQEYLVLLKSFDELNTLKITKHSFLIATKRCYLLNHLSKQSLEKLTNVLINEFNGYINYHSFIIYLRTIIINNQYSYNNENTQIDAREDGRIMGVNLSGYVSVGAIQSGQSVVSGIISQLIENATDSSGKLFICYIID